MIEYNLELLIEMYELGILNDKGKDMLIEALRNEESK